MSLATRHTTVGFDRKIELAWLDATADWAGKGMPAREIRLHLEGLLDGRVGGKGSHSARGKTVTVLLHVWVHVPEPVRSLHYAGLVHLPEKAGYARLPLHWGMCLATYPFFRDVAGTTGRLLGLQGTASLSHVLRRITERWGQRSTVIRAVQRIMRSLVAWGVLQETSTRGVFRGRTRITIASGDPIGPWLLGATLSASERQHRSIRSLANDAALFPFHLDVTAQDFRRNPLIEIYPHASGDEIITWRLR